MARQWIGWMAACVAVCGTALPASAAAFDIVINAGPNLSNNPAALAAFERAAAEWEAVISTPMRVNVNAEIQSFGAGNTNIIGGANIFVPSYDPNQPYDTVRNAMAARSTRPGNAVLAFLPTSAQATANVPSGKSLDTTTIGLTRANLKALGLVANRTTDTAVDGYIDFNSDFTFAYDRASLNGTNVDFQTAAAHELGHVLGFLSDADDFDNYPTIPNTNLTTLDFFRFNAANVPTSFAEFTTKPRELRPGQEAVFSDTVMSVAMSTGANLGDGNQASHWKDDFLFNPNTNTLFIGPHLGMMDPTLNNGDYWTLTAADLRAFELIGYDVVPEPTGGALVVGVLIVLTFRRRRTVVESM
jgi:hypothetical protein